MNRALARLSLLLVVSIMMPSVSGAAGTAEDAVKYRHAVMEEMANHMSALTLILLDKVDGGDYAQGHVDALARASSEMDVLFPEISREGDTAALPAIWEEPDKFAEAVEKAQLAAADFQSAVSGGDRKATMAAFAAAGKTCKGCHESYRAEDDDHDSH
ncbi:MAG: cytochrome c [Gammaproteobacteria bacterium]|nr:cytochrome c [Gammaproteobacteria bacterium]